jgi:hypothetical protein
MVEAEKPVVAPEAPMLERPVLLLGALACCRQAKRLGRFGIR